MSFSISGRVNSPTRISIEKGGASRPRVFSIQGETISECYDRLLGEISIEEVLFSVPLTFRCHNSQNYRDQWVGMVLDGDDVVDIQNPESDLSFRVPTEHYQGYVKEDRPVVVSEIPRSLLAWAAEELIVKGEVLEAIEREFAGEIQWTPVLYNQEKTDWWRFLPKRYSNCLDRAVFLPEVRAKYYDCVLVPCAGIWVGENPENACVRSTFGYNHKGLLKPVVVSLDAFDGLQQSFGEGVFGECVFGRDSSVGKDVVKVLEDWTKRVKVGA